MNRAGYLALKKSMKPASRTVQLTSIAEEPTDITLHHPEAGAVIPGLAANPVLIEFLFNETEEGKAAMTEFTLESVIGMFKRMGPFAISSIIAASMRDDETGASFAGDPEIEEMIRNLSPADQIKCLLTVHEVTNLVDFFALLWSLATILPIGKTLQNAMQNAVGSTPSSSDAPPPASEPTTAEPSKIAPADSQPQGILKRSRSSLADTASTLPFDSARPAADSAEAA